MKELEECKEYYKSLYIDVLEELGKTNESGGDYKQTQEAARFETLKNTLIFIYSNSATTFLNWEKEALNELYK